MTVGNAVNVGCRIVVSIVSCLMIKMLHVTSSAPDASLQRLQDHEGHSLLADKLPLAADEHDRQGVHLGNHCLGTIAGIEIIHVGVAPELEVFEYVEGLETVCQREGVVVGLLLSEESVEFARE